eukprot:1863717-Rhodomonas_salina.1
MMLRRCSRGDEGACGKWPASVCCVCRGWWWSVASVSTAVVHGTTAASNTSTAAIHPSTASADCCDASVVGSDRYVGVVC